MLFAMNCSADLLIYHYTGKQHDTRQGEDLTFTYQGRMILDTSTTNITFVGWATVGQNKRYWVHPETNYYLLQFGGIENRTYSVLGRASHGVDTNDYAFLASHIFKGENSELKTGTNSSVLYPKVFQGEDKSIEFDSLANTMLWIQTTVSFVFSGADTRSCNTNGQTMDDVVNALSQMLESRGYQKE